MLQHPEWDDLVNINGETLYFTYVRENKLLAYAIVRFPDKRTAKVDFGPVAIDRECALLAQQELLKAVQTSTGAWLLSLQLPIQTGQDAEYLNHRLANEFDVKTFADKRNWASSKIDTRKSDEEIARSFSKNHKRSIKKAKKLGLTTRICTSDSEIEAFNRIYVRMYETRGTMIDEEQNLIEYKRLAEFFERTGLGFFFGVFEEDEMRGGMLILKQGDYGFYHHSASDPDHRKLPIQHIGVVSIIDELRARDIPFFDFGGYNHMVDESDQVYNINRFKDGFTKDYMFYPKIMYFEFVPQAIRLLENFQKTKDLVKKVIGR